MGSSPKPLPCVFQIALLAAQWRALRPFATRCVHRRKYPCRAKPGEEEDGEAEEGGRIRLHKGRGQHLLTNPRVLDAIVRKAGVLPDDTVLEIGPGTGNLTLRLLQVARQVIAVEIDPRMVDILRSRASAEGLDDRLQVMSGDALKSEFPRFDLCVANIPYGMSSPLIAKILFDSSAPRRCFRSSTLLLQKEFARRLVAGPGDSEFNRLAMNVSLVATVELLMDVSKRDFVPAPRVDSSLVRIQPKVELPEVDLDEWWAFTRVCFGQKNKTLGAIFKQKRKLEELFKRAQAGGRTSNLVVDKVGGKVEDDTDDDVEVDDNSDDDETARAGDEQHTESIGMFKEKIVSILQKGGFQEKRSTKLSNADMLHLLSLFNQEGIHFH